MDKLVDHDPKMNEVILEALVEVFPEIVTRSYTEDGEDCVEIVGLKTEESGKYPSSNSHLVFMDQEHNWEIREVPSGFQANYGDCLESLIICLKQFQFLWASLTPLEHDKGAEDA